MPDEKSRDPLGAEHDRRKMDEDIPKEGPPVAQMATTYGSSLVTSEEQAERIATDAGGHGEGTHDGLGRPQPPSGQGDE